MKLCPYCHNPLSDADVDQPQAENAQLRERVAELEELTDEKRYIPQEWYQLATTENAQLRKMVLDLYECVSHANEQDWFHFERHMLGCGMSCTVNGEGCGLSVFADRLRELGIEVGE
ncbi:MAG: hypothetical protein IJG82_09420 [Atopobiaceae bacterium]|nr:hypothetical protein [Atopobiaceae bacterium]